MPDSPPERIKFDSFNVLTDFYPTSEQIDLLLSVPLQDGTVTETRISFFYPIRSVGKDGKYEYKMDTSSSFYVTYLDKKADGPTNMTSQDGLLWEIPTNYPGAGTALLIHEPKVRDFLVALFKEGGVFVDVGANVGAYSVRAAAKGMTVHSFEPNPETLPVLRRNAEINKVTLDINEVALGSTTGTVGFFSNGGTSRVTMAGDREVPVRTLDSFAYPRVDVLKVDVEGYELEVLKGARETLARCHPAIMIEMHHWIGAESEAAIFNILLETGYAFQYLDRYANGRHLYALPKRS